MIANIDKSKYKKFDENIIRNDMEKSKQSRFYIHGEYYSLFVVNRNGKFDLTYDNSVSEIPLPAFNKLEDVFKFVKNV